MNQRILHFLIAAGLCLAIPACFWRKPKEDALGKGGAEDRPNDNSAAPKPTAIQADPTPMETITG